jgi:hypothetical protein
MRERENVKQIQVVVLVGRGERDAIEVPERPLRLQAQDRDAVSLVDRKIIRVGEEGPLADEVRPPVEDTVDGLEAKIGHPDVVGIRKDERHAEAPAPVLDDRTRLSRKAVSYLLRQVPIHRPHPRRAPDPQSHACEHDANSLTGPVQDNRGGGKARRAGNQGRLLGAAAWGRKTAAARSVPRDTRIFSVAPIGADRRDRAEQLRRAAGSNAWRFWGHPERKIYRPTVSCS